MLSSTKHPPHIYVILLSCITLQILIALPESAHALRLYSQDEYQAARDRAVQTARNGNYTSALRSFEKLLKLEPDNHGALNDYLTILTWDKQYKKALSYAHFLNFKETPEYVLRALINAADTVHDLPLLDTLVRAYLIRNPTIPKDAPKEIRGKTPLEVASYLASIGMHNTSLSILKNLFELSSDNQTYLADYIAALHSNKKYEEAIEMSSLLNLNDAPEFVLDALIDSSEHTNQPEIEEKFNAAYNKKQIVSSPPPKISLKPANHSSIQIHPIHVEKQKETIQKKKVATMQHKIAIQRPVVASQQTIIAKARAYLKDHNFKKAKELLEPLYMTGKRDQNLLNTVALFFTAQDRYIEAAYVYLQLMERNPEDTAAKRYIVLNLFYAGAPFRAFAYLEKNPELFSPEETNKIHTDTIAFRVRWSSYTLPKNEKRYTVLDTILQESKQEIDKLEPKGDSYNLNRIEMDYIVTLRERGLTKEVLKRYNVLRDEGHTLPDYALHSVADSYLAEEQPEIARDMYLKLLKNDPASFLLHEALCWAYLDNEEYQKALDLSTQLNNATPLWRKDNSGAIVKDNDEKLSTALLATSVLSSSDYLAEAQKILEKMRYIAPYNTDIYDSLTTVYRWRGWPQKAYEQNAIATTIDPDNIYLKLNRTRTLMDLNRLDEAETLLATINKQDDADTDKQIATLNEDFALMKRPILSVSADGGSSDSDSSDYGSSDFSIESFLYDKLYANALRPFLHQYYNRSDFTEGTGRYQRVGIGGEYSIRQNTFRAEISSSYSAESDVGLSIQSNHIFNDSFSIGLSYDSFSTNIPVRAYFHGITGPGYKADIGYRFNESSTIGASYEYLDFSNDNRRKSWNVTYAQRVFNSPKFKVKLTPAFYQSQNSKIGGPFFNPVSDYSYSLAITGDWLTWQHYTKNFSQNIEVNLGNYYQENFGTNPTYGLNYQHQWTINKSVNLTYGIAWSSNYYDGDKENRLAGSASLGWIF